METVGSYEAKMHFSQLLERVEHGESITITRRGKPIARLVPATPRAPRPEIVEVIEAMRTFQEQEAPSLGDNLSIRDVIDEGRRF
jgi:prevent-host-death family protein